MGQLTTPEAHSQKVRPRSYVFPDQPPHSFPFFSSVSSELEDMPDLSHLNLPYPSGDDYALSYPILRENGATALPAIPEQGFLWPVREPSDVFPLPFIRPSPNDAIFPSDILGPTTRHRSEPLPSAHRGPVVLDAQRASLTRRRHPAQFCCDECGQTFTALFSLKRTSCGVFWICFQVPGFRVILWGLESNVTCMI